MAKMKLSVGEMHISGDPSAAREFVKGVLDVFAEKPPRILRPSPARQKLLEFLKEWHTTIEVAVHLWPHWTTRRGRIVHAAVGRAGQMLLAAEADGLVRRKSTKPHVSEARWHRK